MNDATEPSNLLANLLANPLAIVSPPLPAPPRAQTTSRSRSLRKGTESGAVEVREPSPRLQPRWRIPTDPPPV